MTMVPVRFTDSAATIDFNLRVAATVTASFKVSLEAATYLATIAMPQTQTTAIKLVAAATSDSF